MLHNFHHEADADMMQCPRTRSTSL